jgi:Na+/proline symporter
MIAISTIISSLMGILALSSMDICREIIEKEPSDGSRIRFGRLFTVIIGCIGSLLTISLEKISLLTIDTYCGILFSAAFSVILMGFLSKKRLGNLAVAAVILGAVFGFIIQLSMMYNPFNWFYAILASFFFPILFLAVCGCFIRDRFNFYSLK